jgi:hypothetical protein
MWCRGEAGTQEGTKAHEVSAHTVCSSMQSEQQAQSSRVIRMGKRGFFKIGGGKT